MRVLLFAFALLLLFAPGAAPTALGQTQQAQPVQSISPSKLLVPRKNADGTIMMPSFWSDPKDWVMVQQRVLYGSMAGAIRGLRSQAPWQAALTLMLLSFGYGIIHAAGPGHGKTVISAWLLATENELKRGILVAFMSSVVQALSAIAIVSAVLLFLAGAAQTARDVAGVLESASYALIALSGVYLIWSALRPHRAAEPALATAGQGYSHHGDHHHHHHMHDHDHAECGHAHAPEASQVRGSWSLTKAVSLAVAVGIRPCSGAVLVLLFANTLGLYWAGISSTFVMALGTAITVSAIAALAVYGKKVATRLAERDVRWLALLTAGLKLGAGILIVALGGLLFWGSLGTSNGMM
ncbi:nickel/cobalt transporter [soil metagenome]